ncbi:MAG: TonB-dependent receptor [Saprospiraceae bacterium]|nr:TonB-dependent receptor [Candidatus Opimibacter skivensis]
MLLSFPILLSGQNTLRGEVFDDLTGDPLIGANVIIQGTTSGTVTDFDGHYKLVTDQLLPLTIVISYTGYEATTIGITPENMFNRTRLSETSVMIETIQVTGSRISEKQKESPLTVESLDLQAIKATPSANFYDGLGALKDVDMTTASLGFKVINTRGFNSTSPVRSLQIIDGVDNQAPGLNFSLGNFLGSSELDVLKVDIVVGASGAYYGPNAFNGVISMETKSPFFHKGLAGMVRAGQRNLLEGSFRYADALKNKDGKEFFAYKLNFFAFRADDWQAENYNQVLDGRVTVPDDNPGRYDAVNIYGDEYYPLADVTNSDAHLISDPGIGTFYRTGYKEIELVDYDTRNIKANAALHFRTSPEQGVESPELILSSSFGSGTTVYQGDNRFSLKDILFFQNRIEFRKRDKYFIRAYATNENAGSSYDPYFTALRLQEQTKSPTDWATDYRRFWKGVANYPKEMRELGYPVPVYDPVTGNTVNFDVAGAEQWLVNYNDSLTVWHSMAEAYANTKNIHIEEGISDFLKPGTEEFNTAFNDITSRYNNDEGGTRFYDKSALYHVHGEYTFTPNFISEIRVGANYRLYAPESAGTIFNDSIETIRNSEYGFYAGLQEKFFDNKLIASATLRVDKNQNMNWIQTPAASLVYKAAENTFLRFSFSSALRNPTLSDQYLNLDVGPATLAGHIGAVDSLITIESFINGLDYLNWDTLEYFNIDAIRPEKVTTFEIGARTSLFNSLFVDLGYYRNSYQHFLGYQLGVTTELDLNSPPPVFPENTIVYRYSANSKTKVNTQGFSIGLNYYLSSVITLNGNYSYNELTKVDEDDPIIPAYNTPKHKYNLGISGRNINFFDVDVLKKVGFSINYKWVEGFQYEGSPQFTGFVPTYDLLDAQISVDVERLNTTIKIGASNILNNEHYETYGGPDIGRLAYISLLYDFKKD